MLKTYSSTQKSNPIGENGENSKNTVMIVL